MPIDYAVPMEGLRNAERSLSEAAYKIAAVGQSEIGQNEQPQKEQPLNEDTVSWSMKVDFETALLQADQAKIAAQANMKVISTQHGLDNKILDIFK
jgi:hypothetical protein